MDLSPLNQRVEEDADLDSRGAEAGRPGRDRATRDLDADLALDELVPANEVRAPGVVPAQTSANDDHAEQDATGRPLVAGGGGRRAGGGGPPRPVRPPFPPTRRP